MASDYVIAVGSASGITLSSGDTMEVLNGGTAISTAILDSGLLTVSWGGAASATQVDASGNETVESGAIGIGTTILDGGLLTVSSGGGPTPTSTHPGRPPLI